MTSPYDRRMRLIPRFSRMLRLLPLDVAALCNEKDDAAFVAKAYGELFFRAPDRLGFERYVNALQQGKLTRRQVIREMRYSSEGRHINRLFTTQEFWIFAAVDKIRRLILFANKGGAYYVVRKHATNITKRKTVRVFTSSKN